MSIQLYHSGSLGASSHRHTLMSMIDFRLLSLHEQYLPTARNYIKQVQNVRDTKEVTLLFDSGAFTAWKRKEKDIEVQDLLGVLKKAFKYADEKFKAVYAISLDKIPGKPGTTPSSEEVKEAIRISDDNHHILSGELGDRILPVFHQGEPLSRLHEVLSLNPKYICVSPRNDVIEQQRRWWSQRVHKLLPDNVRTHGLATTGGEMMLEVPWHSIDSAAIIQAAAFGKIFIPSKFDNNKDRLLLISVSKQSPNKRHMEKHLSTMGEIVEKQVQELMDLVKVTKEDIETEGGARELINAHVLMEAAKRKHRPTFVQQTLFAL
jgi:hypothetical protein